jgi:hypothetical protein
MASGNTISLAPVEGGWAVILTDGRELARFTGPDAKRRALRYAASTNPVRRRPLIDKVRRAREERGGWRTASSQS